MGLPAVRIEKTNKRAVRPHLRVVRTPARGRSPKRKPAANAALARGTFRVFITAALVVSVLGMGRVWVTVKAAEASQEAMKLQDRIRSERYEGDMLEIRQSALGSPSRIRAIAGETMDMAPAAGVTYLELPQSDSEAVEPADKRASTSFKGVLGEMVELAVGEAEVMLVGDVGLASAR